MEVVASLSQGRTAAAQCGFFTHKSVLVIFETRCICVLNCNAPVENNLYFLNFIHDKISTARCAVTNNLAR